MMATFKRVWAAIVIVVGLAPGLAVAGETVPAAQPAPAAGAVEEPPPEALLAFLGGWDAGGEEWLGPEFFDALEAGDQEQDHAQDHD